MQKCILCVPVFQRCLLQSIKAQKCFPTSSLCVDFPSHGFHVERKLGSAQHKDAKPHVTQHNNAKPNVTQQTVRASQDNDLKNHIHINSQDQGLHHEQLQSREQRSPPREQRSPSRIKDILQQKTTANPVLSLYRSDGLDPVHYSLIYNNVKQTEEFGRVGFGARNVAIRLCGCWMIGNIVVVRMVDFNVIPQYIQAVILTSAGLYIFGFWRFMQFRKVYREAVLRLYKENYGFNKKYVMIKPFKFTSTKQKLFSESDLKRLNPEKHRERFKIKWRTYRLEPENFIKGYESVLEEILGHKLKTEQKKDQHSN